MWFCENCVINENEMLKETIILNICIEDRRENILHKLEMAQQGDAPEPASPAR